LLLKVLDLLLLKIQIEAHSLSNFLLLR
jgi:hypothetical protein